MTNNKEWRCFQCGEVFTNPKAARDHFGDSLEDGWVPGCVDELTLDQKANRAAFMSLYQELEAEREENHLLQNTPDAHKIMKLRIVATGLSEHLKEQDGTFVYDAIPEDTRDLIQMLNEIEHPSPIEQSGDS